MHCRYDDSFRHGFAALLNCRCVVCVHGIPRTGAIFAIDQGDVMVEVTASDRCCS